MQARLPANVLLALVIQKSRQDEEKVGQTIHITQDCRIHRLISEQAHHVAFRAPRNCSCQMQVGRSGTSAREHKTIERFEFRIESVDLIFQPRDLFLSDSQQWFFRARVLRPAQIGADIEQVILNVPQ